jgi:hypothetical protein
METQDCSSLQEDRTTFDIDLFNYIMQEPPDIDLVTKSAPFLSFFPGEVVLCCSAYSTLLHTLPPLLCPPLPPECCVSCPKVHHLLNQSVNCIRYSDRCVCFNSVLYANIRSCLFSVLICFLSMHTLVLSF